MAVIYAIRCLRNQQSQQGQSDRRQHGFERDLIRLTAHLSQFRVVFDLFGFKTGFARTSRSQTYSGFVAPLKESGGRANEW